MALTNSQYDSIINTYNQRRLASHRLLEERTREIYEKLPDYKEVDQLIASLSVAQGKKRIMGEEDALDDLKDILEDLNTRKKLLLTAAGYSVSYLEPNYTCPYCKDTGYIDNEKCHCFKQTILNLLYEQSNIHEMVQSENFETISYEFQQGEDLVRFQNAVATCEKFVENFENCYQNLFFYGTVGTGKSFLSNCVANALLEKGHSVIYFSSAGLFERISEYTFQKGGRDSLSNPFDDIHNCDLLIIDDLGTELTNSFVTSQLFSCLNERQLRHKATIISTNLSFEELRDRYSDRIFSRITSNYEICKLSGQDIRLYKKRMQNRK